MSKAIGVNLIKFYGRDELMERFGTVTPTLAQRKNELEFLWFAFGEANEINTCDLDVSADYDNTVAFKSIVRKEYGPFNVIVRGDRMRFKEEADAVFIRLRYSKH